jgi:uncharacterized lipoprotein YbaY
MPDLRLVRGEIMLPHDLTTFTPAHVLIELEDISRADAPSQVVARLLLPPQELHGDDLIPFTLGVTASALNEQHIYSIRVHVDVSGSGQVERGDYVTVQSYPVLTRGYGDNVRVAVRRV